MGIRFSINIPERNSTLIIYVDRILKFLDANNMTKAEFAKHCKISLKQLNDILFKNENVNLCSLNKIRDFIKQDIFTILFN